LTEKQVFLLRILTIDQKHTRKYAKSNYSWSSHFDTIRMVCSFARLGSLYPYVRFPLRKLQANVHNLVGITVQTQKKQKGGNKHGEYHAFLGIVVYWCALNRGDG